MLNKNGLGRFPNNSWQWKGHLKIELKEQLSAFVLLKAKADICADNLTSSSLLNLTAVPLCLMQNNIQNDCLSDYEYKATQYR